MKFGKTSGRAFRRYLLIVTAISLPVSLIYLVWNDQLLKLKGYEADEMQQRTRVPASQSFRYPVLLLSKGNSQLTVVATGRTLNKWRYVDDDNNNDDDDDDDDDVNINNKGSNRARLPLIPENAVQSLSASELASVEQRMEARRQLLKDKCTELGLDVLGTDRWHKPNTWEFLVNKKYHIIWCNVFKAASSSWMFNFNILAGYSPDYLHRTKKILLNLARERYPRVTLQELRDAQNDSITFIIARNPFERLLSAYRDKMVFALPYSFHDKLGRSIVRNYRKKQAPAERATTKFPTFPEFVRWLLDQVKFGNFIDMHFVAVSSFCTPCLINFDMILKFESLGRDQLYLIEKAGLKHVIAPEWRNMGKGGKHTYELQKQFYSQLTLDEMEGLYDYYKYDFELFNYDIEEYFKLAKPTVTTEQSNAK